MIKEASRAMAEVIVKISPDQKLNVVAFGLEVLIGGVLQMAFLFLVAYFLGVLPTTLAATLAAVIFRLVSGGFHLSTYFRCLASSTVIFVFLGGLAKLIGSMWDMSRVLYLLALLLAWSLVAAILWAPAEHPNRPLKGPEEHRKFKYLSTFYVVLVTFGVMTYVQNMGVLPAGLLAAGLGIGFQAFTFTPLGLRLAAGGEAALDRFWGRKETGEDHG